MDNQTSVVTIALYSCLVIDLPSGYECSTTNSSICLSCPAKTGFFTGEAITDTNGTGHQISLVLFFLILLIGGFGIPANLLIILNFKRRLNNGRKFAFLFSILAVFDTLSCITSMLSTLSLIACFEGWSTRGGLATTYFVHTALLSVMFSRSLSVQTTVFITFYSLFGLSYPLRTKKCLTWRRIKLIPFLVFVISIALNFPRGITSTVRKFEYENDVPSLRGFDYISVWSPTWFKFWEKGGTFVQDQLDFILPLPTLGILNFFSYKKMNQLKKVRRKLTSSSSSLRRSSCHNLKALRPVKMFLPVVSFLLFCNFGSIVINLMLYIDGVLYREILLMCLLLNVLNSSANFVIYYWRAEEFRRNAKNVCSVLMWWEKL